MKRLTLCALSLIFILTACVANPTPTPLPPLVAPTPSQALPTNARNLVFELDPNNTVATYSVDETFIVPENRLNTAIGKTSKIAGRMVLNLDDPAKSAFGKILVDLSVLKSDSVDRDNMIRNQFLESALFPLATFDVKRVENFPAKPQEGQPIQFALVGDLLVKQTTREVKWDVIAALNGDKLVGKAKTLVYMKDFNFEPPQMFLRLTVKDGVNLVVDFTFVKK